MPLCLIVFDCMVYPDPKFLIFLCLCLRLYQDLMFVKYWWDILDLKNRKHAVNLKGCKNSIWLQNRFDHIVLLPSLFFLQICSIFLTSLVDLALIENIFSVILEKGDRNHVKENNQFHIFSDFPCAYFCILFLFVILKIRKLFIL